MRDIIPHNNMINGDLDTCQLPLVFQDGLGECWCP